MGSNPASPTITVVTMCGRFVGSFSADDILNEMQDAVNSAGLRMNLPDADLTLLHNFNVAPTHPIPLPCS